MSEPEQTTDRGRIFFCRDQLERWLTDPNTLQLMAAWAKESARDFALGSVKASGMVSAERLREVVITTMHNRVPRYYPRPAFSESPFSEAGRRYEALVERLADLVVADFPLDPSNQWTDQVIDRLEARIDYLERYIIPCQRRQLKPPEFAAHV